MSDITRENFDKHWLEQQSADFDGGATTSDGGALLLRKAESKIGIVDRIVKALSDHRHQSYIDHTHTDLIRQRVFQIACGL